MKINQRQSMLFKFYVRDIQFQKKFSIIATPSISQIASNHSEISIHTLSIEELLIFCQELEVRSHGRDSVWSTLKPVCFGYQLSRKIGRLSDTISSQD